MENLFRTGKTKAFTGAAMGEKLGRDNTSEPNDLNWGVPRSPRSAGGMSPVGPGAGKGWKAKESFYRV